MSRGLRKARTQASPIMMRHLFFLLRKYVGSVIMGGLFLLLTIYKFSMAKSHVAAFYVSEDGSYYFDLIDNLLAGRGFVTNISPFHHGLPEFPYPSIVYPVWPLFAAGVAMLFGKTFALFYLPPLLFLLSLVLAFWVGRTYHPSALCKLDRTSVHGGHILALGFATHSAYFLFTSRPYTEGLAYVALLLGLLLAHAFFQRPHWKNAALLGLVSGTAVLTRSQNILLLAGIVGSVAVVVSLRPESSKRFLLPTVVLLAVCGLVLLPEFLWLRQPALQADFGDFLKFSSYQHQPGLLPPVEPAAPNGLRARILDFFSSFPVAFSRQGPYGYYLSFGLYCWAAPLLAIFGSYPAFRLLRTKRPLLFVELSDAIDSGRAGPWIFAVCFALGSVVTLHLIHLSSPSHEWYFPSRHGIPAVFFFALCWGALFRMARARPLILAVVLATLTYKGVYRMGKVERETTKISKWWPKEEMKPVLTWIGERSSATRVPVVVTHLPYAKTLRPLTPHAAYRALDFADTPDIAAKIFDNLSADYLVLWTEEGKFYRQAENFNAFATPEKVPGFRRVFSSPGACIYQRAD